MELRKLLLLAVLTGGCAVSVVLLRGQAPSPPPAKSDAPYHQTDMSKPEGNASRSSSEKQPAVQTPHKTSLLGLGKITILPASISITGPHYGQRIVVEGIFADGHQEDPTSVATAAISNPDVASLDGDKTVRPAGDGETTITATLQGRRARAWWVSV